MTPVFRSSFVFLLAVVAAARALAAEAVFVRGVNLNGPALTIDGHAWEGKDAANLAYRGGAFFENQKVPLRPPTDPARTQMIRSSVWNSGKPDTGPKVEVELGGLPAGALQVFLYVWEDNH